jgi:uncharacterized membrane protein
LARQIQRRAAKAYQDIRLSRAALEMPKSNPEGRLKKPTGCVAAVARCTTSGFARLLP